MRDRVSAADWEEPTAGDEPPPELPHRPERGARDQPLSPQSPWSEAGMPPRLREAIASVRRVSHHMAHELPPLGGQQVYQGPSFSDEASHEATAFNADAIDDEPALDDGTQEEPLFEADASDDGPLFDDGAYEEPPFESYASDDEPPLDDGRRAKLPLGTESIGDELPFDDGAVDERLFEESAPVGPAPGLREDPPDRLPVRRRSTGRYGLHVAAFTVAIAFVALAGVGLGLVGGEWGTGSLPAAPWTVAVAPIDSPPAATPSAAPSAQPKPMPPQPAEVVIQAIPPAPAPPVIEALPSKIEATNDFPLPPPPKPPFRQVAASEAPSTRAAAREAPSNQVARSGAPSTEERLASEADDPAGDSLEQGLGGPFQPLFVKLPVSRTSSTRVVLHYPADVVGGPATATHLVRLLKAEGFSVEARAVELPIRSSSIRYFAAADRGRAESVRASLEGQIPGGATLPVLDFTHFEPKPEMGHLEIWLSL